MSIAGRAGGGRFVLKAANPLEATAKAFVQAFGNNAPPLGTEIIVSQMSGPGTRGGRAKQTTFKVIPKVVEQR